jgi:hypothetical protein
MKTTLLAVIFAAVSGYAYAQTTAPKPAKAVAVKSRAATSEPTPAAASVIKIEKMVTATSIENKEPVNETSVFDITVGRVYTWTRVTTSVTPVKIRHIYYAGGKKQSEMELNVKSPTYRGWSSKAVWPGDWKVSATDETGEVLATVSFTVSNEITARPVRTGTTSQGK